MCALTKKADKIVQLLVEHNAEVNILNNDNQTSLSIAVQNHNNAQTIKLLIKYGADLNFLDK